MAKTSLSVDLFFQHRKPGGTHNFNFHGDLSEGEPRDKDTVEHE